MGFLKKIWSNKNERINIKSNREENKLETTFQIQNLNQPVILTGKNNLEDNAKAIENEPKIGIEKNKEKS